MGQVNVTLNGRTFQLWCGDGQEDYVRQLSNHIGRHIAELKSSFGNINDDELFLMAGLLVADELLDRSAPRNQAAPASRNMASPPHGTPAPQSTGAAQPPRQVAEPAAQARVRPAHSPAPPRRQGPQAPAASAPIPTSSQPTAAQALPPHSPAAGGAPMTGAAPYGTPKIDDSRLRSALQQMSAEISRGQLPEGYAQARGVRRVEPVFDTPATHAKRRG